MPTDFNAVEPAFSNRITVLGALPSNVQGVITYYFVGFGVTGTVAVEQPHQPIPRNPTVDKSKTLKGLGS